MPELGGTQGNTVVQRLCQPLQMPVPTFVPAPDSADQCANTDGLFFPQGPILAMVQGHGQSGESGGLVETLVTAFGPTLRFMCGIGSRPLPEGFVYRR